MKALRVIPPLLAAAAAVVWIGSQAGVIRALEKETAQPKKSRESRSAFPPPERGRVGTGRTALDPRPIDWHAVAEGLAEAQGVGYLRTNLQLEEALRALSEEEMLAALDEIEEAGLPGDDYERLRSTLKGLLARQYPEAAMKRFVTGYPHALRDWAKESPEEAIAWFDEQIAQGAFDSRSLSGGMRTRNRFEAAVLGALLSHDTQAAGARLAALPEDERMQIIRFHSVMFRGPGANELSGYAQLLRDNLSEEDRLDAVTWRVSERTYLGETGTVSYAELDTYLDQIEATPAERDACILAVARRTRFPRASGDLFDTDAEDLDALRTWVGTRAPALVDEATGRALDGLLSGGNFPEVAEMALHYYQAGGSDEVLLPLLESHHARDHQELARAIAQRLSDEERRREVLEELDRHAAQP